MRRLGPAGHVRKERGALERMKRKQVVVWLYSSSEAVLSTLAAFRWAYAVRQSLQTLFVKQNLNFVGQGEKGLHIPPTATNFCSGSTFTRPPVHLYSIYDPCRWRPMDWGQVNPCRTGGPERARRFTKSQDREELSSRCSRERLRDRRYKTGTAIERGLRSRQPEAQFCAPQQDGAAPD